MNKNLWWWHLGIGNVLKAPSVVLVCILGFKKNAAVISGDPLKDFNEGNDIIRNSRQGPEVDTLKKEALTVREEAAESADMLCGYF